MMIAMWPVIPMFLIQLHGAPGFWRKIGVWTYTVVFLEWLPIAWGIMFFRDFLLQFEIPFPEAVFFFGVLFVVGGVLLHSWTAKLLGIKATLGFTEIKPNSQVTCKIVVSGPFSVTRHPSYWAHTFILLGTFLISGIISVGVIVIIDLLIAYFITIELEEKELVQRFGDDYKEYKKQVPKFFPRFT